MSVSAIKKRLKQYSNKKKIPVLQRFFKTGPGEYAQGDIFIGVMVPYARKVVKEFKDIGLKYLPKLLRSPIHEERLTALLILVYKFKSADDTGKKKIYRLYMKNSAFVNNWDLVDLTAHHIIGGFLNDKDKRALYELAKSKNLWERRLAVIATFYYIRNNDFEETLRLSGMLMGDKEDLIHKAVGWMLREVGKRDVKTLEGFLSVHCENMPRTMLRYAIEKFPEPKRKAYLSKKMMKHADRHAIISAREK
ncbi:MAG: DNA alkylation repair protein [Candidatus Omnitrophota bacterium]|nr:DNA alkylation repair protein [Candidatus Omnitrophota bacterium]